MKRILLLVVCVFLLGGCMTTNQLKAEQSYYEAMVAMQKERASQPVFEMTPAKAGEPIILGNVGSFKVYAPVAGNTPPMQQYVQKDYVVPILDRIMSLAPFAAIGWVATTGFNAMKEMGSSTNMTISGQGNTGSVAPTHNVVSGTGNYGAGTSTPTVVMQPPPQPPIVVGPSYPPK